jgi:hypothetical protein
MEEVETSLRPVKQSRVEVVVPEHLKLHRRGAPSSENHMEGSLKAGPTLLHRAESPEINVSSKLHRFQRNVQIHSATVE